MLRLDYRGVESLVRYWADNALALSSTIEDASLEEACAEVQAAQEELYHDRRILCIGGQASGKSSLLAGLTRLPFLTQYSLEEPYVRWRYCCKDGDRLYSRFIQEPDLIGIELVDTQALEKEGQYDIIKSLLTRTDILMCVLDAREPQQKELWQFIEELPEEWGGHCLLAVTHTDCLGVNESLQLKLSLREKCHNLPHQSVATYFVPTGDAKIMASFAMRLRELINSPECHRAGIRHLSNKTEALLHAQNTVLSARETAQRMDSGFVDSIEREIDYLQQKQMEGHADAIERYISVARDIMPRFARVLWAGLSPFWSPSKLLQLECFAESIELYYYRALNAELLRRQDVLDRQFIITCESHWQHVRPRMHKTLRCDIGDFDTDCLSLYLADLRQSLMQQIYDVFMERKLRSQLMSLVAPRLKWLKWCFLSFCIGVSVAGVLGALDLDQWAWLVLAVLLLSLLCMTFKLWQTSRAIRQAVLLSMDELIAHMQVFLKEPMADYIIKRVAAYRRMYVLPRQSLAKHAQLLEPIKREHSKIQRQLHALSPHL